jgi:preprotein translocase subunit SecD
MVFSRWRVYSIVLVCLISILIAIPNFLPSSLRDPLLRTIHLPLVPLGLDLRGGSYVLLEVDIKNYIQEQQDGLLESIRNILRKEKIPYTQLKRQEDGVRFQLRNANQQQLIQQRLNDELARQVTITHQDDVFSIHFTEEEIAKLENQVIEQSIEIVRRRVDEMGTKELTLQRQGRQRILLQVPGLDNPEQLKKLIGKTARLTFHLVDEKANIAAAQAGRIAPNNKILPFQLKANHPQNSAIQHLVVERKPLLTGDVLTNASPAVRDGQPEVHFSFNTIGARTFGSITKEHVGKMFAIVLDDQIISAPVIREPILGGSGTISGGFTLQEANDLALLLRAGALPAPLTILEERSIGPSLGEDSIIAGTRASLLGISLVILFMIGVYKRFGVYACIGLLINMVMLFSAMALLQATLTVPGIAGIVLTMGMSVDANVLIYERIKEEIRLGSTPLIAIQNGFKHAFTTIFDSNITLFMAAVLLFLFGSGPVRGFAVTLILGIATSMFSAISVTRLLIHRWYLRHKPKTLVI